MRSPVAAFLQILIPGNGIKRVSGCFEYLFHSGAVRDEVNALGYPKKTALCDWLNEDLQNNQRKWSCKRSGTLVRCSQEQKEMAVKEYCSGEKAAEIIKKGAGISPESLSNREKAELIDALRDKYRLKELLQALHLSKSSYCYHMNALKRPDKYCKIRTLIREIFDSSKRTYGSESEKK